MVKLDMATITKVIHLCHPLLGQVGYVADMITVDFMCDGGKLISRRRKFQLLTKPLKGTSSSNANCITNNITNINGYNVFNFE